MKISFTTKYYLFLLTVFALQPCFLSAQSIRTSISKKQILIGEQIVYRMSVGLPSAEYAVSLNIPDSVPHFDIIERAPGSATDKKNNYSWEYKLVFTSFDSGTWNFPALSYRISHRNTASQPLATQPFSVAVGYMPLDAGGKPRDIQTIFDVEYFDWFWIWIAVGALILLVLLFFLYRYLKKRKKTTPLKIAAGAYEEALKALEELRVANSQQSLSVKEYHTRLANVFKNYYTHRAGRDFLNKTTDEILSVLKTHQLKAETSSNTASALQTGDAVKFAKYHSTYTENEAALDYLKRTIEETEISFAQKI